MRTLKKREMLYSKTGNKSSSRAKQLLATNFAVSFIAKPRQDKLSKNTSYKSAILTLRDQALNSTAMQPGLLNIPISGYTTGFIKTKFVPTFAFRIFFCVNISIITKKTFIAINSAYYPGQTTMLRDSRWRRC